MPVPRCRMQRREPLGIAPLNIGTLGEQQRASMSIAGPRRSQK